MVEALWVHHMGQVLGGQIGANAWNGGEHCGGRLDHQGFGLLLELS
jgi:hypothetical protein